MPDKSTTRKIVTALQMQHSSLLSISYLNQFQSIKYFFLPYSILILHEMLEQIREQRYRKKSPFSDWFTKTLLSTIFYGSFFLTLAHFSSEFLGLFFNFFGIGGSLISNILLKAATVGMAAGFGIASFHFVYTRMSIHHMKAKVDSEKNAKITENIREYPSRLENTIQVAKLGFRFGLGLALLILAFVGMVPTGGLSLLTMPAVYTLLGSAVCGAGIGAGIGLYTSTRLTPDTYQQRRVAAANGSFIGGLVGLVAGFALSPLTAGASLIFCPMLGAALGGGLNLLRYKRVSISEDLTKDIIDKAFAFINICCCMPKNPIPQGSYFSNSGALLSQQQEDKASQGQEVGDYYQYANRPLAKGSPVPSVSSGALGRQQLDEASQEIDDYDCDADIYNP